MEDDIPDHIAVMVKIVRIMLENPREGLFVPLQKVIVEYALEQQDVGRAWRPNPSDTLH
jgi:hypothetical protein